MTMRQLRDQKAPGEPITIKNFVIDKIVIVVIVMIMIMMMTIAFLYTWFASAADQLMWLCLQKKLFKSKIVQ